MESRNCYFSSTIFEFNARSDSEILRELEDDARDFYSEEAGSSQIKAWKDEISVLRSAFSGLRGNFGLILEYILPRERGRRPDVILLSEKTIFVLEFKQFSDFRLSQIDQVLSYARDLREYQSYCREKSIQPVLILTKSKNSRQNYNGVEILTAENLSEFFNDVDFSENFEPKIEIQKFLAGEYEPLPTILQAAKLFFKKETLPQIRTAKSLKISETISFMQKAADSALKSHENLLMLVTGVPGAGKTLIGLQFTFDNSTGSAQNAVMLSRNGSLVQVLQYVLKSKNFITDVHGFLKSYGGNTQLSPKENIIIYDEAQRAWDADMAREKRGEGALSEPQDLMKIAQKKKNGIVLVALVREGQEINRGEEARISQWNEAILKSGLNFRVLAPSHVAKNFKNAEICDFLNLNSSLRSKSALDFPKWVSAVLSGNASEAKILAENGLFKEFPVYISHNLRTIKNYAFCRYEGENEKRYGLLASSKAKNLEKYGIPNGFMATRAMNIGAWYADSADSPFSCCALTKCATEFSAQGLELDFPILCWGDDFIRKNEKWDLTVRGGKNVHNPYKIRENCYRVLLTRGREGLFIFVPDEDEMRETFEYLVA